MVDNIYDGLKRPKNESIFRYEMNYKFRENGYSVDYLVDFSVTTDLKNSR